MSFGVWCKSHVFGKHYHKNKETLQTISRNVTVGPQDDGWLGDGLAEFLGEFIFLTVRH